jgi:hypothetical protein
VIEEGFHLESREFGTREREIAKKGLIQARARSEQSEDDLGGRFSANAKDCTREPRFRSIGVRGVPQVSRDEPKAKSTPGSLENAHSSSFGGILDPFSRIAHERHERSDACRCPATQK